MPTARRPARSGRARRRASSVDMLQHSGAALPPWIELVRLRPLAPRVTGASGVTSEPSSPAELVVRLHEIRPQGNGLLEEYLRVVEHLALEVEQSEVVVR